MDPSGMIDELKVRREALYAASFTLPFSMDDVLPRGGEEGGRFFKSCTTWCLSVEAAMQAGTEIFLQTISAPKARMVGSLFAVRDLIGKPILRTQLESAVASEVDFEWNSLDANPCFQRAKACIDLQRMAMNLIEELTMAITRLDSVFLPRLRLGKGTKNNRRELHIEIAGFWKPPREVSGNNAQALVDLRDNGICLFNHEEKNVSRFLSEKPEDWGVPELRGRLERVNKGEVPRRLVRGMKDRILPDLSEI